MKKNLREFTQSCIYCIISPEWRKIPSHARDSLTRRKTQWSRPRKLIVHGARRKKQIEVFVSNQERPQLVYMVMACRSSYSNAATSALSKWISRYGYMQWLVIDQESCLKTTAIKNMTGDMQIRHHFMIPYRPCSNGTVQRLFKEILRIARASMSKWEPAAGSCPAIVDAIQWVVSHSPVERFGRNANENLRCPNKSIW